MPTGGAAEACRPVRCGPGRCLAAPARERDGLLVVLPEHESSRAMSKARVDGLLRVHVRRHSRGVGFLCESANPRDEELAV